MNATLVIYRRMIARRNQRWRWKLVTANGRKIANGGEGYSDHDECEQMAIAIITGRYKEAVISMQQ